MGSGGRWSRWRTHTVLSSRRDHCRPWDSCHAIDRGSVDFRLRRKWARDFLRVAGGSGRRDALNYCYESIKGLISI